MTIYEFRWANAVRWAKRINRALSEGHLVFVGGGEDRGEIKAPLEFRGNEIFGPFEAGCESGTVWFRNDPECDDGSHTEINAWNERNKVFCYASVAVPLEEAEATPCPSR